MLPCTPQCRGVETARERQVWRAGASGGSMDAYGVSRASMAARLYNSLKVIDLATIT